MRSSAHGPSYIYVADIFAGGSTEIVDTRSGAVVVLGGDGNQLREAARFHDDLDYADIAIGHFLSRDRYDILATGSAGTVDSVRTILLAADGELATSRRGALVSRRRSMGLVSPDAVSRDAIAGDWNVELNGDCPLLTLSNWSVKREGIFVDVQPVPACSRSKPRTCRARRSSPCVSWQTAGNCAAIFPSRPRDSADT